jgi:hypothetical protein
LPSRARDRVATSGVRLSPFSIAGLTTTRLRDSASSFRQKLLIVLQANLDRMVFPPHVTVGLVPTDPAALTASLILALARIKFMSAGLPPGGSCQLAPALCRDPWRLRVASRWCLSLPLSLHPSAFPGTSRKLASRFAFQPSSPTRSLQPALAEGTYRYVTGTGKTVIISGLSSAGLRRWMWSSDDRADKIGCRLRNS